MKRLGWLAMETAGEGLIAAGAMVYDLALGLLVAGAFLVATAFLNTRGGPAEDERPLEARREDTEEGERMGDLHRAILQSEERERRRFGPPPGAHAMQLAGKRAVAVGSAQLVTTVAAGAGGVAAADPPIAWTAP